MKSLFRMLLPGMVWLSPLLPNLSSAEPSQTESILAEALFQEARKLMQEERFDEACPKFDQSLELAPGGGTVLNLAICLEKQNKTASAWSRFREARALAEKDGREDRRVLAESHIAELEPKLPRVRFLVSPQPIVPVLHLDGQPLPLGALDIALPVDPGMHKLVATATGFMTWASSFELQPAEQKVLTVPILERQTDSVTLPEKLQQRRVPASPHSREEGSTTKTLAWATGVTGVLALAVGGTFGALAIREGQRADELCSRTQCTTPEGREANDDSFRYARFSNAGVGVGLVAVSVSAFLFSIAPRTKASPSLRINASSASLSAAW